MKLSIARSEAIKEVLNVYDATLVVKVKNAPTIREGQQIIVTAPRLSEQQVEEILMRVGKCKHKLRPSEEQKGFQELVIF